MSLILCDRRQDSGCGALAEDSEEGGERSELRCMCCHPRFGPPHKFVVPPLIQFHSSPATVVEVLISFTRQLRLDPPCIRGWERNSHEESTNALPQSPANNRTGISPTVASEMTTLRDTPLHRAELDNLLRRSVFYTGPSVQQHQRQYWHRHHHRHHQQQRLHLLKYTVA